MTSATSARGPFPIVDLHDITTGQATYGIDAKIPGMRFAVIARPPVVGGKLASFDATEALKVPGVEKVVEVQGFPWPSKFMPVGGVAVVARNTGCAIMGRDKLKLVWDNGPNEHYDSAAFRKEMEQTAASPCKVVRNDGDAEAALKSAAKVVTAQVRPAASRTCQHGAAERGRARLRGEVRRLRAGAKSRRLSRRSGQAVGHSRSRMSPST